MSASASGNSSLTMSSRLSFFAAAGDEDFAGSDHFEDAVFSDQILEFVKFGGGAGLFDDIAAIGSVVDADMEFLDIFGDKRFYRGGRLGFKKGQFFFHGISGMLFTMDDINELVDIFDDLFKCFQVAFGGDGHA